MQLAGTLGAVAKDGWDWKDEHLSVRTLSRDDSNACACTVSQGSPGRLSLSCPLWSLFVTILSADAFLVSLSHSGTATLSHLLRPPRQRATHRGT